MVRVIYIEYETKKLDALFCDIGKLERKIGKDYARALVKVIKRFRAAVSYNDIVALGLGKPHNLQGDMKEYCAISISANIRLIYKVGPNDTITMKGVCDYHGEKNEWLIP